MNIGDEVEIRLKAKVVNVEGGCALVEIFLARPSKGNLYRTFVGEKDCHPVTEQTLAQKIVYVPKPEAV